jgi:hypothetical protein
VRRGAESVPSFLILWGSLRQLAEHTDGNRSAARRHTIDIVLPPGIGIPRIADIDVHQTIVRTHW